MSHSAPSSSSTTSQESKQPSFSSMTNTNTNIQIQNMQSKNSSTPSYTSGMLIVGIGGNNGVTTLAGVYANQNRLKWESPTGLVEANYLGCITQLPSKGGKGGYREKYSLKDINHCAIAGWDIRDKKLGDALYDAHILDYDLVRQVREHMNNNVEIMRGVWDPSFIGESQHDTATHAIAPHNASSSLDDGDGHDNVTREDLLLKIRNDIREFRRKNNLPLPCHITLIWSASVERPSAHTEYYQQEEDIMDAIRHNDPELSPSILYAVAGLLEGCSFVNGGSQNTVCPGLVDMGNRRGLYILGTDFKAGQTKFKTAAVEYIRALGLQPIVMASSNHLGNNDMLNLTSKKTLDAKMRVKQDIFAKWEENIDHQVRVMYTPYIGDEKRDIVEYTSLGFLNSPHTMLTYTRCMDSILCVPLMIDVTIWCDYFFSMQTSPANVSKALAYLFKIPEGDAKNGDPGFFDQMQVLEKTLESTLSFDSSARKNNTVTNTFNQQQNSRHHHPLNKSGHKESDSSKIIGGIVCIGAACLDLQLIGATANASFEAINVFEKTVFCPGGAAAQASLTLGELKIGQPISIISKIGSDAHGRELCTLLNDAGVNTNTMVISDDESTSLAVLPILKDGRRGCYANLSTLSSFTPGEALTSISWNHSFNPDDYRAIHFGYPHILRNFQGKNLRDFFMALNEPLQHEPLISMDLNGVQGSNEAALNVILPALPYVDVLHLNTEECELLTGISIPLESTFDTNNNVNVEMSHLKNYGDVVTKLRSAASFFFQHGVAIIAITLGKYGAFVAINNVSDHTSQIFPFERKEVLSRLTYLSPRTSKKQEILLPSYPIGPNSSVNANGAGDAFISGLVAMLLQKDVSNVTLDIITKGALLTALHRVDTKLRTAQPKITLEQIIMRATKG